MRNVDIDITGREICRRKHIQRAFRHFFHRGLKYEAPFHTNIGVSDNLAVVNMAVGSKHVHTARAVGFKFCCENSGFAALFEHRSASSVTEENAGCTIIPIQNARKAF